MYGDDGNVYVVHTFSPSGMKWRVAIRPCEPFAVINTLSDCRIPNGKSEIERPGAEAIAFVRSRLALDENLAQLRAGSQEYQAASQKFQQEKTAVETEVQRLTTEIAAARRKMDRIWAYRCELHSLGVETFFTDLDEKQEALRVSIALQEEALKGATAKLESVKSQEASDLQAIQGTLVSQSMSTLINGMLASNKIYKITPTIMTRPASTDSVLLKIMGEYVQTIITTPKTN